MTDNLLYSLPEWNLFEDFPRMRWQWLFAVAIPSYVINSTSTGITRILTSSSVPEVARFSVNMQWLNIFGGSPPRSVTAVL